MYFFWYSVYLSRCNLFRGVDELFIHVRSDLCTLSGLSDKSLIDNLFHTTLSFRPQLSSEFVKNPASNL